MISKYTLQRNVWDFLIIIVIDYYYCDLFFVTFGISEVTGLSSKIHA